MTDLPLSDELAAIPAPWGSVLGAVEALAQLGDTRYALLAAQVAQIHAELAELRDELHTRALKAVPS